MSQRGHVTEEGLFWSGLSQRGLLQKGLVAEGLVTEGFVAEVGWALQRQLVVGQVCRREGLSQGHLSERYEL